MAQTRINSERILTYSSYYIDIDCESCGVNILEYVKKTGNPVYASTSRQMGAQGRVGNRKYGKRYRCKECYDVLFGGVSVR